MATDTNGVWSDKVATAEFAILPAFYQTRWFLTLCVVAAVGALYLIYLLRLRQVAQKFRIRMEERTRIARELHDTLLQSFQGLLLVLQSGINLLREPPDVARARERLQGAIDQAEQAITEGRDAVQGLRSSTMLSSDFAAAINTLGAELRRWLATKVLPPFMSKWKGRHGNCSLSCEMKSIELLVRRCAMPFATHRRTAWKSLFVTTSSN